MKPDTRKYLQSPIAACLVKRKEGVGYVVDQWLKSNIALTNQHALDLLENIEDTPPEVNSSLIRKRIDGKNYLIVGTVWAPPNSNDRFLIKWYGEPGLHSRKRIVFFLPALLVLLVLSNAVTWGVGCCFWQMENPTMSAQNHSDFPVQPQNSEGLPKAPLEPVSPYESFFNETVPSVLAAYGEMLEDTENFVIDDNTITITLPKYLLIENMKKDRKCNAFFDELKIMQGKFDEIKISENP